MRKLFWTTLLVATLVVVYTAGAAAARPSKATFTLPEQAKKVAPGVYYLGEVPYKGRVAEGYAFVDYGRGYGKPGGSCNNDGKCQGWEDASCVDCTGGGNGEASTCYGFLSNGAKWKSVEDYIVNPSNIRNLNHGFVTNNLASNISKWETASGGVNILGSGSSTSATLEADTVSPDNKNEVYFADIAESDAIAVTIVWGYFRGHPSWRQLIEWDQIYDDVDYDWSDDCLTQDCTSEGSKKMDFENIATHELGHSVGMDDLYNSDCSDQTMYGYATEGETEKRTLEAGDITGVKELYK